MIRFCLKLNWRLLNKMKHIKRSLSGLALLGGALAGSLTGCGGDYSPKFSEEDLLNKFKPSISLPNPRSDEDIIYLRDFDNDGNVDALTTLLHLRAVMPGYEEIAKENGFIPSPDMILMNDTMRLNATEIVKFQINLGREYLKQKNLYEEIQ